MPLDPDSAYRDASIYVDAVTASRVVARLRDALGLEDNGPELTVGPMRVSSAHNDYATGRRAHPFDFLEWPTVWSARPLRERRPMWWKPSPQCSKRCGVTASKP